MPGGFKSKQAKANHANSRARVHPYMKESRGSDARSDEARRRWREETGPWEVVLHDDVPSGKHRLSYHRKRRVHTDKFVVEAIMHVCAGVDHAAALAAAHGSHSSAGYSTVVTVGKAEGDCLGFMGRPRRPRADPTPNHADPRQAHTDPHHGPREAHPDPPPNPH